ncbi:S26 family signal peptidase [Rubinisphaera margarita]|uniref:S26 family signal peptidase n=1 Tax=Rubinisphaera margarita TaxID=2909586 RepID=UPI001EE96194|nr:S26 family signal peptidase [Rubinisphaera margarita]MCG6158201.1 S26 family signal peptidase [Rubinisphaera margarita]
MPGQTQCGRCGSMLAGGQVAIDVLPPRASKRQKWARSFLPNLSGAGETFRPIRDWFNDRIDVGSQVPIHVTELGILLRMPIPGWPHLYCGWTTWGLAYLFSYFLLLLISFLTLGTPTTGLFFGMAIAVHATSIASLFRSREADPRERVVSSLLCIFLIGIGVYLPLTHVVYYWTNPIVLAMDIPPFREGETFLTTEVTADTPLNRGDTVVFIPNRLDISQPGRIYRIDGPHVDRVIALPGDKVKVDAGELLINGEPSRYQPLNKAFRLPDMETTISPNQVLVFPSSETVLNNQERSAVAGIAQIPRSNVNSVIRYRIAPFYRMGRID